MTKLSPPVINAQTRRLRIERSVDWIDQPGFNPRERCTFVALVLLGLSTTIYISFSADGLLNMLRPVQVVPIIMGLSLLPSLRWPRNPGERFYYALPLMLTCYILARHSMSGLDGLLIAVRSVGNLLCYWSMLILLGRLRTSHGLIGLHLGCLLSVVVALLGFSFLGISPRMGSGRWQGFMPGANRFANLCLITLVTSMGPAITRAPFARLGALNILISGCGIVMSGSRACVALSIIGVGLVFMLSVIGQRRLPISFRKLITLVLFGIVFLGAYVYLAELIPPRILEFVDRIANPTEILEEDSRSTLHDIAYEYFVQNPLFGAGVQAERFEIGTLGGDVIEISAHSTYWHLLSVSGLTGLVLFLSLPLLVFFELFSALVVFRAYPARLLVVEVVISLSVLLIFGLHNSVISLSNSMHTWILFGACANTAIQCRRYRLRFAKLHFVGALS